MRFKVGDVVVVRWVRNGGDATWFAGAEVTIEAIHLGSPSPGREHLGVVEDCTVRLVDGRHAFPTFAQLAPKRPPLTELGSWDAIEKVTGWSPTREIA